MQQDGSHTDNSGTELVGTVNPAARIKKLVCMYVEHWQMYLVDSPPPATKTA